MANGHPVQKKLHTVIHTSCLSLFVEKIYAPPDLLCYCCNFSIYICNLKNRQFTNVNRSVYAARLTPIQMYTNDYLKGSRC